MENVVAAVDLFARVTDSYDGETFIVLDDEAPADNYRDVEVTLWRDGHPRLRRAAPGPAAAAARVAAACNGPKARVGFACNKLASVGFCKAVVFEAAVAAFGRWYVKNHPALRR